VEGFMWESVVVIHMKTDEKHNQNIDLWRNLGIFLYWALSWT
jgi:hypothetical protein